jgi:cytochrome P450
MSVETFDTRRTAAKDVTRPAAGALAHIPGDDGWPFVGHTLAIIADHRGFVQRRAQRFGMVYRNRAFGHANVTMLGPEANELVFLDPQKQFSSALGWGIVLDKLFPRGLMLLDFDEHRLHRRVLSVAFKAEPMRSYLAGLNAGIAKGLGAMAAPARVQVLSRDQAADARPRGDFLSRRGTRA